MCCRTGRSGRSTSCTRFRGWRNYLKGLWDGLHPLTVAELGATSSSDWKALRTLGGFSEPFFGGSARQAKRWSTEHRNLLIRDELLSLERVDDVGRLELMALRLV